MRYYYDGMDLKDVPEPTNKEFARQMRENAVIVNGVVQVSQELWNMLADVIETQGEWISVDERLPEYEHPVLATDVREDYTAILTLKAGGKVSTDCWEDAATGVRWPVDEMTHWMPLPEAPKGD